MSDGMGREFTYLSSHATNRYFIPNWGKMKSRFWCHVFLESKNVAPYHDVFFFVLLLEALADEVGMVAVAFQANNAFAFSRYLFE